MVDSHRTLDQIAHPPSDSIFLGDLTPIFSHCGWGNVEVNLGFDGHNSVSVMGKSVDTFVFAHGPSLLVYTIPEGSRAFSAIGAGIEHPDTELTDWNHSVYIDGKLVAEGGPYSRHRAGIPIRTAIPEGSKIILFKVDNLVNSVWAYPFFHYRIPWDD